MLNHSDPLESFIGTPEVRVKAAKVAAKRKGNPGMRRKDQIAEVERRIANQDWNGATAGLLVALYWTCHRKVYGVDPIELDVASTWTTAMKAAGGMVAKHFDGDVGTAIKFMRWLWTREQQREAWAKQNGISRSRITWIKQFHRFENISDWRADKVRRQG